jgi:hypothetical protein
MVGVIRSVSRLGAPYGGRSVVGPPAFIAGGILLALASAIAMVLAIGAPAGAQGGAPASAPAAEEAERRALDAYRKLPLSFVPNAGQTNERVRYLAQGTGSSFFFFTDDKVTLSFAKPAGEDPGSGAPPTGSEGPNAGTEQRGVALELRFIGANPNARVEVGAPAPGKVNDLTGAESERRRDLPTFGELTYRDLWPGIDMVFRGQGGKLKYEFHVKPGADPSDIQLAYAGAEGLSVTEGGSLEIDTVLGTLRDSAPVSYQPAGEKRVPVESRYAPADGGNEDGYGFALAGYDRARPLVIDPGLEYSTFLGGSLPDAGNDVAVDEDGNAYVTGRTNSADYPTTPGAFDRTYNQSGDAFVTKLNESGSRLVYSTYLGGSLRDEGFGIEVDDEGRAYVTGGTFSADYPTSRGAFDQTFNGFEDAFVTKLNESGARLVYSTYLGGSSRDVDIEGGDFTSLGNDIAIDEDGNAYVAGGTFSADYPTTPGAFDATYNQSGDAYVTKLNESGSRLVYSTFLGGTNTDAGLGVAVDEEGTAYLTGNTASVTYPTTPGAFDQTFNGFGRDAFVTKLNESGSRLVYSTYLGGSNTDEGRAIAIDEDDDDASAYITGRTISSDYPTTPGAFDQTNNGFGDAYVTKLNESGSRLDYSTFLGGSNSDEGRGIAVGEEGRASVTGRTFSLEYPTTDNAFDRTNNFGDAFVTKLNEPGSRLVYSTFLGGSNLDEGNGIDVEEDGDDGDLYVTGRTFSPDFPTTPGAFDQSPNGFSDVFVTKLSTQRDDDDEDDEDEDEDDDGEDDDDDDDDGGDDD